MWWFGRARRQCQVLFSPDFLRPMAQWTVVPVAVTAVQDDQQLGYALDPIERGRGRVIGEKGNGVGGRGLPPGVRHVFAAPDSTLTQGTAMIHPALL